MKFAFYRVFNTKNYDRHTFDGMSAEEIETALNELNKDECEIYDLEKPTDACEMVQRLNDDALADYWCVTY